MSYEMTFKEQTHVVRHREAQINAGLALFEASTLGMVEETAGRSHRPPLEMRRRSRGSR